MFYHFIRSIVSLCKLDGFQIGKRHAANIYRVARKINRQYFKIITGWPPNDKWNTRNKFIISVQCQVLSNMFWVVQCPSIERKEANIQVVHQYVVFPNIYGMAIEKQRQGINKKHIGSLILCATYK